MRAVVQRVAWAKVEVSGDVVGQCGPGFLVFAAAHREDTDENARRLAERLAKLRVLPDSDGKMNLSILDQLRPGEAQMLLIPNFTVYGETAKNRRPSFIESAPFEAGERLFARLVDAVRGMGIGVQTGVFGADMKVSLLNDGPVTVIVEG